MSKRIKPYRKMRWFTWVRDFQPIDNPFDPFAGDGGLMFETYGQELEYVREQCHNKIWTLLDCDGKLLVASGYHFVNRLGYYITQVPFPDEQLIDVV